MPATDVRVKLVAQHAFEYFVFQGKPPGSLPPYRLKVEVGGEDQTALGERMLRAPFTFPFDLHFNRITHRLRLPPCAHSRRRNNPNCTCLAYWDLLAATP